MEMQSYSEHYSGPVPHPDILRQYDFLVPGAAELIINAAISQTHHRQVQEARVIAGSEDRANRGQILGFVLLLLGVICGLVIALAVDPLVGGSVIGGALASGALVYVIGGRPPKGEDRPAQSPPANEQPT